MKYPTGFAGALALAVLFAGPARAEPGAVEEAVGQDSARPQVVTTPDGMVPPKIGVFQFAARKIQKLTAAGDVSAAETLLLQKEGKLSLKPYYTFLLVNTGNAVRKSVQPQMTSALGVLGAVNGRKKFTDNSIEEVTAALNGAASALKVHASHPLLKRPQFVMPEAAEINAQLALAGGNLKKNAKAYFLAHDHNASNFFQVYPLEQTDDDRKVLVAASDRWITVAMASEQPGRVLGQYMPWANEKMQAQARRALAAQIIKRNRWPATLGIGHEFHLAAELGIELSIPAENIALVTIGGGGPAIPGVDRQQTIESAAEIDTALDALQKDGVRYALIYDLGRVLTYEQVKEKGKPETSKRVVGTRRVPNPAYAQAQQAVSAAQQNLAAAQQRAAQAAANAQMANALFGQLGGQDNSQGWAALAGKTMSGMASSSASSGVAGAQAQLQQAQYALANTPTQVDEPVEESYPVPTRLIERTKIQELAVYYVDLQKRSVLQASQRETQRKTATVMVQFDAADRHQEELKGRNESQMNDLRMALPADLVMEQVSARLDNPLLLVARASARGANNVAALVAAEADAWEDWEQRQLAASKSQVELSVLYSNSSAPQREERQAAAQPAPMLTATDPDSILWYETKQAGTIEAYEWYMERFPKGLRVGLARAEIRRLKAGQGQ